jgi:SAM-dependent methyltransferase
MREFIDTNRAVWDEMTALHQDTAYYDVAGFLAGRCTLRSVEVEELGDVAGKSLLHLQCHFGLDTLSWARRGARVTGADFSPTAVARAREFASQCGLDARFVCSTVEDLPAALTESFDIVFTSYGVLCWLADLRRWAEVAAHFLRPGGTFYLAELHPFADVFDDNPEGAELKVAYPYFHSPAPIVCPTGSSYADRSKKLSRPVSYQWSHSLGDVVSALCSAGLRIDFLHEFPLSTYAKLPGLEDAGGGYWRMKDPAISVPLLFSLRATRPA